MSLPFVELNREQEENSFFHFWHKVSLSPMYLLHSLIHRSRCHRLLLFFISRRVKKESTRRKSLRKLFFFFFLMPFGVMALTLITNADIIDDNHSDDDNFQLFICIVFFICRSNFLKSIKFFTWKVSSSSSPYIFISVHSMR